jgi:phosphate/sulfate permease
MLDERNPYKSPEAEASPLAGAESGQILTEMMLAYLRDAVPWLRFMGIVGFVISALTAFTGLILSIGMAAAGKVMDEAIQAEGAAGIVQRLGFLGGFVYLGIAALGFFLSRFVYLFGAKIRQYSLSYNSADLEMAFKNNRSLWRFLGIYTIVCLSAAPVLLIIGAVVSIGLFS